MAIKNTVSNDFFYLRLLIVLMFLITPIQCDDTI